MRRLGEMVKSHDDLEMWVVYSHPKDYPDEYVARRWVLDVPDKGDPAIRGKTLAEVRNQLPPGLTRMDRDPLDDPVIVEIWI